MTIDDRDARRSARAAALSAASAQYLAEFCRTQPRAIYMAASLGLANTPSGSVYEALDGNDIAVYRNDNGVATFISRRLSDDDLDTAMAALASATSGMATLKDSVLLARTASNAASDQASQAIALANSATSTATTGPVAFARIAGWPQTMSTFANLSGSGLVNVQSGVATLLALASSTDIAVTTSPDGTSKAFALTPTGVVAGAYGGAAQVPVLTVDANGRITAINTASVLQAAFANGTGVLVTYDGPSNTYTISVPILSTKAANLILAGPASGTSALPGFRSLVAADLPSVVEFPLLSSDPSPKANTVLGYMSATTQRLTLMYPDGTKTELGGT